MTLKELNTVKLKRIKVELLYRLGEVELELMSRKPMDPDIDVKIFRALQAAKIDTKHPSAGEAVVHLAVRFARQPDGIVDQDIYDRCLKQGMKMLYQDDN